MALDRTPTISNHSGSHPDPAIEYQRSLGTGIVRQEKHWIISAALKCQNSVQPDRECIPRNGESAQRFAARAPVHSGGRSHLAALFDGMQALSLAPSRALAAKKQLPLTRGELVQHIWLAIRDKQPMSPPLPHYLSGGHDTDGDGIADLDEALPLDRDNNSLPDGLEP